MRRVVAATLGLGALVATSGVAAQTRTPWEMNRGTGVVRFASPSPRHGDPSEYDLAMIPAVGDPGWGPAPDGSSIGFEVRSALCDARIECRQGADFTYFRAVICVPDARDLGAVAVTLAEVDDGARVTVFNRAHPEGVTPSNGFAFLNGGTVTSGDFAASLVVGAPNTLVVTHVDDCCQQSFLRGVRVVANGREMPLGPAPELCNALDDDCDGETDEGFGTTSCGVGACARTVENCAGGAFQRCEPGAPGVEVCNGLDDDCDGETDEALGESACGEGRCRRVVPNCRNGAVQTCTPGEPAIEVCNDIDDDCNGLVDDFAVRADAGADAATLCSPELLLEGRAGPWGSCTCEAGVGPNRGDRRALVPTGLVLTMLLRRVRRRTRLRSCRG